MRKVGTKGQIVIEKRIRDELGVEPGWHAIQRVVDGRVVISFVPPPHTESLMGIFANYVTRTLSNDELEQAIERAADEAAVEDWMAMEEDERKRSDAGAA